MQFPAPPDDTLEISGLSAILDEDEDLPYLELTLRASRGSFRAAILQAEGSWTVNVRDENGRSCPGSGELYDTQGEAIYGAMLLALAIIRWRVPLPLAVPES